MNKVDVFMGVAAMLSCFIFGAFTTAIALENNCNKSLKQTEVEWVRNAPDVTGIHEKDICFTWKWEKELITSSEQTTACIER